MSKNTTKGNNIVTREMPDYGYEFDDPDFQAKCNELWNLVNALLDLEFEVGGKTLRVFPKLRNELCFDNLGLIHPVNAQKAIVKAEKRDPKVVEFENDGTPEAIDKLSELAYAEENSKEGYEPASAKKQSYAAYWAYRDKAASQYVIEAFFGKDFICPTVNQLSWMFDKIDADTKLDENGLTDKGRATVEAQIANELRFKSLRSGAAKNAIAGRETVAASKIKAYLEYQKKENENAAWIIAEAFDFSNAQEEAEEAYQRALNANNGFTDITVGERVYELFYGKDKDTGGKVEHKFGVFEILDNAVFQAKRIVAYKAVNAKGASKIALAEAAKIIRKIEREHFGSVENSRFARAEREIEEYINSTDLLTGKAKQA